ncbi:MAG: hypothetical protein EXR52_02185 [Dehalococcoidia bacterium]|nr:hypothetical protein [Dehalococcoidia bacterium]
MINFQRFVGVGCLGLGTVWVLQGIGVLPGSFMTGQSVWFWIGTAMIIAGAGVLYRSFRR